MNSITIFAQDLIHIEDLALGQQSFATPIRNLSVAGEQFQVVGKPMKEESVYMPILLSD
jgi:hypothetical protein